MAPLTCFGVSHRHRGDVLSSLIQFHFYWAILEKVSQLEADDRGGWTLYVSAALLLYRRAAVALTCKPHYILPRESKRLRKRVSRLFTPLAGGRVGPEASINQRLGRGLTLTASHRQIPHVTPFAPPPTPLCRASARTQASARFSHVAFEGFQTRPEAWDTPTVPACGRARAVFPTRLTCPRMQ